MRLLFLNPIAHIGGAERVLLAAVAEVRRTLPHAAVRVLCLADGPLITEVRELGAAVDVLPLPTSIGELGDSRLSGGRLSLLKRLLTRTPALRTFIQRLRGMIAAFRPHLVHSNGIKTHLLSRLAVPPRVPVVWHIHDFYGLRPLAGWLLRRSRSRVRAAVAISDAVAADASSVLPGVRVWVVPNAVDLNRFRPSSGDGAELDHLAGLPLAPPATVRVGLVATYARWKGHLTLLDAAAKHMAESPTTSIRWYIVGGPIYKTAAQFTEAELRDAAEARGLSGRVGFVPFAPNPVPIYRALDVVVHASTQPEPFGLTIVEAMACGRAVVASAAGGATELFTDGRDALGVAPGDVTALAAAVARLCRDAGLRASLGEAARATAVARFDRCVMGQRLLRVYESLGLQV